jgi:hypothetical protein
MIEIADPLHTRRPSCAHSASSSGTSTSIGAPVLRAHRHLQFHTQPHDASGEKKRAQNGGFERRPVTPPIQSGVVVLAFTDDYDVFSHLSAKWSAN